MRNAPSASASRMCVMPMTLNIEFGSRFCADASFVSRADCNSHMIPSTLAAAAASAIFC